MTRTEAILAARKMRATGEFSREVVGRVTMTWTMTAHSSPAGIPRTCIRDTTVRKP